MQGSASILTKWCFNKLVRVTSKERVFSIFYPSTFGAFPPDNLPEGLEVDGKIKTLKKKISQYGLIVIIKF